MAYKANRKKQVQEDLELVDYDGKNVLHAE